MYHSFTPRNHHQLIVSPMLRLLMALALLVALSSASLSTPVSASASDTFYVRSSVGNPWNNTTNQSAMNAAFGVGNWSEVFFQTLNPATLFAPATKFIFMDGSENYANDMETFLSANQAAMETWVTNGGRLFINAAPSVGDGMNYGFGGVTLNYPQFSTSAAAANSANPIFNGPFTPVGTNFTGANFAHATITGGSTAAVINGAAGVVLAEQVFCGGHVLFGGMSTTNFHSPQPQATNLRQNILAYLNTLVLAPLLTAPSISINNLSVTEGNSETSSAEFTVSLSSSYCKNVTVNYATADSSAVADSDYLMVPSTPITFSAGETSKAVSVPINGDVQVEPNETFFVNLSAAVSATIADGQGVGTINNDDTAGVSVSTIGGNTSESGGTASFSVVLNSQPSANVSIVLSSSDTSEGTVSLTTLTFTSADWNQPQTAIVNGVDDTVDDGNVAYSILTTATSADSTYNGLVVADVSVVNIDNDNAGISIFLIDGNTSESGGTASFSVELNSQPTANVSIGLSSSDSSEGTVSPATLTFTSANWNQPQTVTATGVDDSADDGDVVYTIITAAATSSDSQYSGIDPFDFFLFNIDNDGPGITVAAADELTTTEAGNTATFSVVLESQPSAAVSIDLSSSNTSEGTVSPATLTFTSANWNQPQTVTVTGVDDDVDDDDRYYGIIIDAAISSDNTYNGLDAADVLVLNTDDDTVGITVSPLSGLITSEAGDTTTFTMVLDSQPSYDVSIDLSSSNTGEGTVSPATVIFTSANWNEPQTVTVTGQDEDVDDGDIGYSIITAPASSFDDKWMNLKAATYTSLSEVTLAQWFGNTYDGLNAADVSVINTDNDTAGISPSAISGNTSELSGTASFSVVLDSQPSADVTIELSSSDTSEGTVSPATLTFNNTNWSEPQAVTVTGVDDELDDGDTSYSIITSVATSIDPKYSALNAADVSVINTDNDTAGISVSTISDNTSEVGGTASFSVVLESQPSADVSIGLSSSNPSEGTVSPATLTFTAANWNQVQTVTATGIDDVVDDGDVAYDIITAAPISSDLVYSAINPADVSLFNIDNDGAGVTVTRQGSSTDSANTSEVGDVVTFTLALNSQPSADVSIGLSSNDISEGTVNTATLTFTNANWNQTQTITATGVDDFVVDGNVGYLLLLAAATSTDANYDGENPADQPLTNLDNDGAGITVTPTSGLITSEAGGTASFSVVLGSQPIADVSISLSSDDTSEGTVSPATLIFTAANWNQPQTATATGVDDDGDDNNTNYSIVTAAASSTDDTYSGLDAADVDAINTDNDTAGIIVSATSGMVTTEAGGTATFSVVLNSQPSADVNIFLSSSNITEGTINPISLRFTASNWNTPQVLIVTGQADDENDGNVTYTILTTVSSGDSNYSAINPADVSLTNLKVVSQLYLPMIFR